MRDVPDADGSLRDDLASAVHAAKQAICLADTRGRVLYLNRAWLAFVGLPADADIAAFSIADFHPEDDARRIAAEALPAAARDGTWEGRTRVRHRDGRLIPVHHTVAAHRGPDGAVRRFSTILHDITERLRVERALSDGEARLRSVLETAPDFIVTVDATGTILFVNRTPPPLTIAQVVGTSCFDYVPRAYHARMEKALRGVFTTREIYEFEAPGPLRPDGERAWTYTRAGPLVEGGHVVAATLCATDITALRRESARRREIFERLEKIARMVPGVVYQFRLRPDGTSCFPYASEGIREIYRVAPADVVEDASKVFDVLHPDDHAGIVASIAESARTLEPWRHEYRVRFPDGTVRWLNGHSVPERRADGSTLWHGFITDVTDRKAREAETARLHDDLRQAQKVESIGRLAGGVAHEFNNLLTSVIGFAEMARNELPPGTPARTCLDTALESATRGAVLTEQLLSFARRRVVQPELVDVGGVVRRMAPMVQALVGETTRLVVSTAAEPCVARVDVGGIEQVVVNLALNSRDAMPGGGTLTIAVSSVVLDDAYARTHPDAAAGRHVLLAVTDSGGGMSPDVQARVFEPFFTTKAIGAGTGLGLAVCHGIVRQAGGHIAFESAPGNGTTFRVHVPWCGDSPAPRAREADAAHGAPQRGRETILVVEDDAAIRSVLERVLGPLGYRVAAAADGEEALEVAARLGAPVDLLVTDVVMPRMGGAELAGRLSAGRPGMKVLFVSGYTQSTIDDGGVLDAGIEFLQKPFTPAQFAARVRAVLDGAGG